MYSASIIGRSAHSLSRRLQVADDEHATKEPLIALLDIICDALEVVEHMRDELQSHAQSIIDYETAEEHAALVETSETAAYVLLDISGDAHAMYLDVQSGTGKTTLGGSDIAFHDERTRSTALCRTSFGRTLASHVQALHHLRFEILHARADVPTPLSDEETVIFSEGTTSLFEDARDLAFEIASFSDELHQLLTYIPSPVTGLGLGTILEEGEEDQGSSEYRSSGEDDGEEGHGDSSTEPSSLADSPMIGMTKTTFEIDRRHHHDMPQRCAAPSTSLSTLPSLPSPTALLGLLFSAFLALFRFAVIKSISIPWLMLSWSLSLVTARIHADRRSRNR